MSINISDATNIGIPKITEDIIEVPQSAISPEAKEVQNELADGNALLISTDTVGERFLLDQDLTKVGRDSKADIFLDDPSISRRHAEFIRRDGKFFVQDIGSLNGTYVNRQLDEGLKELTSGDEVQIGKFRLLFVVSDK